MPGCKIDRGRSLEFKALVEHWQKTHPHIEDDLREAFTAIAENTRAKSCRVVPRYHHEGWELLKYRQNSKDNSTHGSSYGWRILAIHDVVSGVLYPIIVYPKTAWQDAKAETVQAAIQELKKLLQIGQTSFPAVADAVSSTHACPNCGPEILLVAISRSNNLECPDCQRQYKTEAQLSGEVMLILVVRNNALLAVRDGRLL